MLPLSLKKSESVVLKDYKTLGLLGAEAAQFICEAGAAPQEIIGIQMLQC